MRILRTRVFMLMCPLAITLSFAASAAAEDQRASGRAFCDEALGRFSRAWSDLTARARGAGVNAVKRVYRGYLSVDDYVKRFLTARYSSVFHLDTIGDLKWSDPVRLAHFSKRAEWWMSDLLPFMMLASEPARGRCNWRALRSEYVHMARWPASFVDEHGRPTGPKYILRAYDENRVDDRVAIDFPSFKTDPELRAIEVMVGPTLLFAEGSRRLRAYGRFTLLILRKNLVVGAYPTIELRAESSCDFPPRPARAPLLLR